MPPKYDDGSFRFPRWLTNHPPTKLPKNIEHLQKADLNHCYNLSFSIMVLVYRNNPALSVRQKTVLPPWAECVLNNGLDRKNTSKIYYIWPIKMTVRSNSQFILAWPEILHYLYVSRRAFWQWLMGKNTYWAIPNLKAFCDPMLKYPT